MRFSYVDGLILKGYGAAIQPYYCHLCGKCEETCPRGVEISTINRCLMYAEAYGSAELARTIYGKIPLSRSASACLDCGDCPARCVNGLDLPVKMERARKLLA
jgi:predicted aldo/keto reductase-like oxidoreductase